MASAVGYPDTAVGIAKAIADANAAEHLYARHLITLRVYLARSRPAFLYELDRLLVALEAHRQTRALLRQLNLA